MSTKTTNRNRTLWVWVDQRGWAFDRIASLLSKAAPKGLHVRPVYHQQWSGNLKHMQPGDVALAMWWPSALAWKLPEGVRLALALFDHDSIDRHGSVAAEIFKRADLVFAGNDILADQVQTITGRPPVRMDDGVDSDLFQPMDIERNDDRYVVGFCGRTEMKVKRFSLLQQAVELLDPDKFRMVVRGFGERIPHEQMPKWYAGIDLLVCTSTSEGTPNPVLEACACGRQVLSTPVGLVLSINEHGGKIRVLPIDPTPEQIAKAIVTSSRARKKDQERASNREAVESHHGVDYSATIDAIMGLPDVAIQTKQPRSNTSIFSRRRNRGRMDRRPASHPLAPGVTCCVVTTERETLGLCLEGLDNQTAGHYRGEVRNVSPMDEAFRKMTNGCSTEYLVQVDDDMILYPHAVRTLLDAMEDAGETCWMVVGLLHDVHLDRDIEGVKLYRTSIVRSLGWRSTTSCEVDLLERASVAGYRIHRISGAPLGDHEIGNDQEAVFERYRLLTLKGREYGYIWPTEIVPKMLGRVRSGTYTDRDLWALAGAIVGSSQQHNTKRGEADASQSSHEYLAAKERIKWTE